MWVSVFGYWEHIPEAEGQEAPPPHATLGRKGEMTDGTDNSMEGVVDSKSEGGGIPALTSESSTQSKQTLPKRSLPLYLSPPDNAHDVWTGTRIRRLRAALRISQAKFARLLSVDRWTVGRWEHGYTTPLPVCLRGLVELEGKKGELNQERRYEEKAAGKVAGGILAVRKTS